MSVDVNPEAIRLLVVDDEAALAANFAKTAREWGFDTSVCHDGPSAIKRVAKWNPNVVLMDVRMPRMDGFAVCRKLRESGWEGPIILWSSYESPSQIVVAHEAGADDFVLKVTSPAILKAKLRRAGQRAASSAHPRLQQITLPVPVLELTRLEERLLRALFERPTSTISLEDLLRAGWGRTSTPMTQLYDAVTTLRKKLRRRGWKVKNVRRKGYKLIAPNLQAGERGKRPTSKRARA